MKKTEKFLKLEGELKEYLKPLGEAAEVILEQGVSKYPIFVIHQQEVEIGLNIIDRKKVAGNWSANASTLEEFVTKQIIKEDKLDEFKNKYKNPEDYLCIFSLSELGATFIYIKRL